MRYFESPSCQWQLESHSITCKIFNMSGARPLRAELPAIEFNREIQYTFSLWFILTDILMESTPKLGERKTPSPRWVCFNVQKKRRIDWRGEMTWHLTVKTGHQTELGEKCNKSFEMSCVQLTLILCCRSLPSNAGKQTLHTQKVTGKYFNNWVSSQSWEVF